MFLLVNNHSQFMAKIRKCMEKLGVEYSEIDCSAGLSMKNMKNIAGVIFSGGPDIPETRKDLGADYWVMDNFKKPVLGICLGHQIIAYKFGSKTGKMKEKIERNELISIDADDELFSGIVGEKNRAGKDKDSVGSKRQISMYESHQYCVSKLPKDFVLLAHSKSCGIEAMKHATRPIYSVQFHPEGSGKAGLKMIENFVNAAQNFKEADEHRQ